MKDRNFLQWIHGRLVNVHGEKENYDFMLRLQAIINKIPADQHTPVAEETNKTKEAVVITSHSGSIEMEAAKRLIEHAATCRASNSKAWMEGLTEKLNQWARAAGSQQRYRLTVSGATIEVGEKVKTICDAEPGDTVQLWSKAWMLTGLDKVEPYQKNCRLLGLQRDNKDMELFLPYSDLCKLGHV